MCHIFSWPANHLSKITFLEGEGGVCDFYPRWTQDLGLGLEEAANPFEVIQGEAPLIEINRLQNTPVGFFGAFIILRLRRTSRSHGWARRGTAKPSVMVVSYGRGRSLVQSLSTKSLSSEFSLYLL